MARSSTRRLALAGAALLLAAGCSTGRSDAATRSPRLDRTAEHLDVTVGRVGVAVIVALVVVGAAGCHPLDVHPAAVDEGGLPRPRADPFDSGAAVDGVRAAGGDRPT